MVSLSFLQSMTIQIPDEMKSTSANVSMLTVTDNKWVVGGAWVAQWVKASAFGSGRDPRVLGSSPESGSLLLGEPASSSLSATLSTCDLSLSIN